MGKGPEKWHLPKVFTISLVLGAVACVSSLVLCWQGTLQGHNRNGHRHPPSFLLNTWFGLEKITYYELQAVLYLKISIPDFLTVFAARTRGPFWSRKPGTALLCAAMFSMSLSTMLAAYWPFGAGMKGISWQYVGLVWCYCLLWFFIQDMCKVCMYKVL